MMKDEYGSMDDAGDSFTVHNFTLENGAILPQATLRYQTYGTLDETTRDNVLVICHALTGNASVHSWWGDLLGPGRPFDTKKYFIVCANILGSCYGSTNPTSLMDPHNNDEVYGESFPDVSVQDTVRLQLRLLREQLRIHQVQAVIGGSFGGMQAMEYAVQTSEEQNDKPYLRSVIPIACGAQHTAWQIGISQVQRYAIAQFGKQGLNVARQMAMLSYRTPAGYHNKFGRQQQDSKPPPYGPNAQWSVQSYLEYQGTKFLDRFDPITYVKLTEQMDSHDIARNRHGTVRHVLSRIRIPALVMGIDSDILYPLAEQQELADGMPNAELKVIHSPDGHDGFLLEQEQVGTYITEFLNRLQE